MKHLILCASASITIKRAISAFSGAGVIVESGISLLPAAQAESSVSKDRTNVASDIGAMDSRTWIALGRLMFLGM